MSEIEEKTNLVLPDSIDMNDMGDSSDMRFNEENYNKFNNMNTTDMRFNEENFNKFTIDPPRFL